MKITVELSGGLELLFNKQKKLIIELDNSKETIALKELVDILVLDIKEKKEFFITKENCIRPGIIVLVNDDDWDLLDKEDTVLSNGDKVSFISTLHGG